MTKYLDIQLDISSMLTCKLNKLFLFSVWLWGYFMQETFLGTEIFIMTFLPVTFHIAYCLKSHWDLTLDETFKCILLSSEAFCFIRPFRPGAIKYTEA